MPTKQKNTDKPDKRINEAQLETLLRRIQWLFSRSGVMALAFEHFLAMVPATILVPIMVNNTIGVSIIDMSLVLFTSGLGTILFTCVTKGKIPAYLGSSFAYIGLTIYLVQEYIKGGTSADLAYVYVGWAYIFSGALLFLLSFLYKKQGIEKFLSTMLPASVVGPAISLIGLELADTALVDSGFDVVNGLVDGQSAIVALITLVTIVFFSLVQRKKWKNASIILGMLIGYIVYLFINGTPAIDVKDIKLFTVPAFNIPFTTLPSNIFGLFIAVIPATFIIFMENIGRVTVINRMVNETDGNSSLFNSHSVKSMESGLRAHGISTFVASLLGSVPNTIYAENIAVMGIHKSNVKRNDPDEFVQNMIRPYSWFPYILAACIAILFSFIGGLQTLLLGIPKCVIGGMEMFLFGIISAPGIQLLVDQRVNYNKVSNQIITASVLIAGISGLSVNLGGVELKGMTLGFVVGLILNIVVQILRFLGNLSDSISFDELLAISLSTLLEYKASLKIIDVKTTVIIQHNEETDEQQNIEAITIPDLYHCLSGSDSRINLNSQQVHPDVIRDIIKHTSQLSIGPLDTSLELIRFRETANRLFVDFRKDALSTNIVTEYLNDYPDAIDLDVNFLCLDVAQNIPMRKIQRLLRAVSEKYKPHDTVQNA